MSPREESSPLSLPPGDTQTVVEGPDGTRLFTRSRQGPASAGDVRAYLCDGILCDGFIWKYLWPALAQTLAVTHWHYRGHGRSAPPRDPERIDIAAHADDLMAVRTQMGGGPAVLFGHSMGCQVALEAYRRHPANIRGLVLMCGTFGQPTRTFHGHDLLDQFLPKIAAAVKSNQTLARALWSRIPEGVAINMAMRMGELDPGRLNPEDFRPYLSHMKSVDFPMFVGMLSAAGEHTAIDVLSEIRVPVLIIAGERDTFTPPYLAEKMAKLIPDAKLLLVREGTHVAPIEQHDLVDGAIETFLRERVLAI